MKQFVLSLELDADGSLLEVNGEPVARVLRIASSTDREKLKAAILSRRDESRTLNEDWEDADRELWDLGIISMTMHDAPSHTATRASVARID